MLKSLIRGCHRHCLYWHLIGSSQNIGDTAKCLLCKSLDRITFSYDNLHDMTHSVIEISKVGVQLPEWWTSLCLYVWQ